MEKYTLNLVKDYGLEYCEECSIKLWSTLIDGFDPTNTI